MSMASVENNNDETKGAPARKERKEVSMAKLSTHETDVKVASGFTVMSSTGDVIIWGEGPRGFFECGHPCSFHVYGKSGGKWRKKKTLKALCRHPRVKMLPIKRNDDEGELLAVSCVDCRTIRLHNMDTKETTVVFTHKVYRPGRMCHGEKGRILVLVSSGANRLHVLELDYTKGEDFVVIREGITDRFFGHYNGNVAYVPPGSSTRPVVVVSSNIPSKTVREISLDGSMGGWERWYGGWGQQLGGLEFSPSGVVYSPRHEALLVADKVNSRVVVLDPEDGSHLQTVPLDNMGHVIQMCLYHDQIVVWHYDPYGSRKNERISYFSTPMFDWDKLKP